jgi:hypothetical protein
MDFIARSIAIKALSTSKNVGVSPTDVVIGPLEILHSSTVYQDTLEIIKESGFFLPQEKGRIQNSKN